MLLVYNLLMLAVDAALILVLVRYATATAGAAVIAISGLAALCLAVAAGEGPFGLMRLLACGLFIHGPILALALAVAYRRRRLLSVASLGLALILAGIGFDAFFVEPYWLQVTRLTLQSPKIHRRIRIVALADFQTDRIGQFERDVMERVMAERPDIVLFVGDYIQVDPKYWGSLVDEFRQLLRDAGLDAPHGMYAVKGNIDPRQWTQLFLGSAVRLFEETGSIDLDDLRITGLSQPDSLDPLLRVPPAERFHIVFGHHPDYALGNIAADVMIAGHTHGGQVRLPVIGPLLTLSRVPRAWAAGTTDRGSNRTLVVSRGTGLERGAAPRLRFLCRPELVVIDLEPAAHRAAADAL